MTISELNEKLYNSNYIIENPNEIIDTILDLFEKKDYSLINQADFNKYPNSPQKFFNNLNVERIIKIFEKLFIKNKGKIDFIHFEKYFSFINQNYYISEQISSNIFRNVSNFNDDEMIKILSELKDELCNDNLGIVLNSLYKQNRLTLKLFKDILNISSFVDVDYFSYLLTDFSDEFIEVLSDYDINVINYLAPERLTNKLLEKAKEDDKYELTDRSPNLLFDDVEFIKKYIKHHPYKVKQIKKLYNNKELLDIAINNGLELNYEDFKEKQLFTTTLFIKEFEKYFANMEGQHFGNITVISKLHFDNEENQINQLYELFKYALNNSNDVTKILEYLKTKRIDILLNSFEENNLNIDFVLDNSNITYSLLESLKNEYANKIKFEPSVEFIDKFFQLGYSVNSFSSEKILNSNLLFNRSINYNDFQISKCLQFCKQDFITKEYIDLAIQKNVNILDNGIYEKTDNYLKKSVEDKILLIDDLSYKNFVSTIINQAGYSIYYVECDNLLSKEVFYTFGEELITKLVRNLSFCGEKLNLSTLIDMNSINVFKQFYDFAKLNGNALEFKYLLEFFYDNKELVENLLSQDMTIEEVNGLKEYIYHKDKLFKISNKEYLSDMRKTIYLTNQEFITNESNNKILLKSIIFSTLFNIGYYEIDNLLGIIGNDRLDNLTSNIKDNKIIKIIESIKPYVNFIEMVYSCDDNEKLIEIANNINNYYLSYGDEINQIKLIFDNIESKMKSIYSVELNSNLTTLPDEKYIEFNEDSCFLAHVMNAFGNGSQLSDFKNPKFIGKTYICLSAIGHGINPYSREEIDKNHVTLLFNSIPSNSLISMSSRDMWSQGGNGQLDVKVTNNFNTLNEILNNTSEYVPNEYVVYRENENGVNLYPCGILVIGEEPSQSEIEAANYLNVPLVKRKLIKRINKSNSNSQDNVLNEIDDQIVDNTFYEYIQKKVDIINEHHHKI